MVAAGRTNHVVKSSRNSISWTAATTLHRRRVIGRPDPYWTGVAARVDNRINRYQGQGQLQPPFMHLLSKP
jgi:hypothetical protein